MPKPLKTWISSHPGRTIAIWAIVLAIAVIAAVGFAIIKLNQYLNPKPQFYSDVKDLPISTYSLSGKVKSISGNDITFSVGQVVTKKDGNEIRYFDKTAHIGSDTKIFRKVSSAPDFEEVSASQLAADQDITVYTTSNTYENDAFTADKIEIN